MSKKKFQKRSSTPNEGRGFKTLISGLIPNLLKPKWMRSPKLVNWKFKFRYALINGSINKLGPLYLWLWKAPICNIIAFSKIGKDKTWWQNDYELINARHFSPWQFRECIWTIQTVLRWFFFTYAGRYKMKCGMSLRSFGVFQVSWKLENVQSGSGVYHNSWL